MHASGRQAGSVAGRSSDLRIFAMCLPATCEQRETYPVDKTIFVMMAKYLSFQRTLKRFKIIGRANLWLVLS